MRKKFVALIETVFNNILVLIDRRTAGAFPIACSDIPMIYKMTLMTGNARIKLHIVINPLPATLRLKTPAALEWLPGTLLQSKFLKRCKSTTYTAEYLRVPETPIVKWAIFFSL